MPLGFTKYMGNLVSSTLRDGSVFAAISLFTLGLSYLLAISIYRLYFHPLAAFPGRTAARLTEWYRFYHGYIRGGRLVFEVEKTHAQLGPVIRIAPNELHFASADAYNTIYGARPALLKEPRFYANWAIPNGLFGRLDPQEHHVRRDILNPLFSKRTVANLSDAIISSTADKFLLRMAEAATHSTPIPLDHAFKCFTIDIISLYTFNKSSDTLSLPDFDPAEMRELLHTIKQAHFTDFFPWVQKLLFLLPARVSRFLNLDMAGLIQVMMRSYALVCDYKARGETEGVLSAMLSEKKGYCVDSDMALAQLALEFLGAGMEETSNALMFATWYITRTPRVEERLVQELKKAIPDVGENATRDLERLPYLHAVWKEALRLSHGVPGRLPRIVPKGGMDIENVFVPGGTIVSSSSTVVHLNAAVFPEPHVFNPDRWLGENAKSLEKHLVAFSRGPRQCIGMHLAESEFKILLGNLMRRYKIKIELETGDELKWRDYLTCIVDGKIKAVVEPRE